MEKIQEGEEYPWEDVIPCRQKQNKILSEKCEACGENLEQFYFKSPKWTWEELCGVAGTMTACFKCKKQYTLEDDVRS